VRVYVTGAGDWREMPAWPPPSSELSLHLQARGQLGELPAPSDGSSSFTYDPADPTPTLAGPLLDLSAGVRDNVKLEARPDVLTFTTDPLAAALEIIGTPMVELDHSRSNRHSLYPGPSRRRPRHRLSPLKIRPRSSSHKTQYVPTMS